MHSAVTEAERARGQASIELCIFHCIVEREGGRERGDQLKRRPAGTVAIYSLQSQVEVEVGVGVVVGVAHDEWG